MPAWIIVGCFFILSKKRLPNARVSTLRSQYHGVVRYSPCATVNPSSWTSFKKTSKPAGFIVLVTPNSFADFKEFEKSVPAFASPKTWAPELWACSTNEEKSEVWSGTRTAPTFLPPFDSTTLEE